LLTGADQLSAKQWRRLEAMLDRCDPTKEIGARLGVKERLRLLLTEQQPSISGASWPTSTTPRSTLVRGEQILQTSRRLGGLAR
jgi:hypothetical protein